MIFFPNFLARSEAMAEDQWGLRANVPHKEDRHGKDRPVYKELAPPGDKVLFLFFQHGTITTSTSRWTCPVPVNFAIYVV